MNNPSSREKIELPSIVPFSLNAALAGGLGFTVAGWRGAAVAIALLIAVFCLVWFASYARRNREKLNKIAAIAWTVLKPFVGLFSLPFVLLLTIIVVSAALVGSRLGRFVRVPSVPVLSSIQGLGRKTLRFLRAFFRPANLPATAANLLLLLTLLSVAIGIEVAFYVALAAVPVMILTFAMVAIEFSFEPGEE